MIEVYRKDPFSGQINSMLLPVTQEQLDMLVETKIFGMSKWDVPGVLIQNAFPDLNADQREFLMTGITPEVWNETFSDEQE